MLTGTTHTLTDAERAREPRSLAVLAWFDGWAVGAGMRSVTIYPRRLDWHETQNWRDGFDNGRRERVCHSWHGFAPCGDDHPRRLATDREHRAAIEQLVTDALAADRRAKASNGSPATE